MNAEQAAARRCVRLVRRYVRAGMIRVQRARRARCARAKVEEARVRFDGRRPTVADVRAIGGALAVASGRHVHRPRRPVRFVGRGLSFVNGVTFAVLLGHVVGLDPAHPVPGLLLVTVVLAACSATAQAVLAVDVGRRLRSHLAGRWPEPAAPAVIGAGLLASTGGLAFVASYEWAQEMGSGSGVVAAGLVLGAAALAAPFVMVANEVYGPGPEDVLLGRAERILTRWNRRCRRLEKRADRHLAAAERLLWRAEGSLGDAVDHLGPDHALVGTLAEAVAGLRAELQPEPADPLDPDDLDLVG